MDELSVGLVGAGNMGLVHLQSVQALPGATVEAAADIATENRDRARRLGVETTYEEYTDLLEQENLDVVIVALPPFLHADATIRAIEEGCHVFVEKPFARTSIEAEETVDAAARAGVHLGVDHTMRYMPQIQRMKEAYDEGRLGHVPLAAISRINNGPFSTPPATEQLPTWQLDSEATGGGALLDLGVHLFDVLEWFFGEVTVTHATIGRQLALPFEDTATVVVESARTGTVAMLTCGFFQWEEPPDINMRFRLEGVAQSIGSDEFLPNDFVVHAAGSAMKNLGKRLRGKEPAYYEPTYFYRGHYHAVRDFLEAIHDDRTPPVSGAEGVRTIQLVEDTFESAQFDPATPQIELEGRAA